MVPSTLNCTLPNGVEVEPIAATVAVNVSVLPFAGVFELAVSDVNVEYCVGEVDVEPPEPPSPQLETPTKIAHVMQLQRTSFLRLWYGTMTKNKNAMEMLLAPAIQRKRFDRFEASGPELTDWACVVAIVNEVLPEVVNELGEKTQEAWAGSPEQENVTVPENPFSYPI